MRHGRGLVQRWLAGCWLWFEHLMKSFCTHCHWLVGWLGKSDLGQLPPPSDPAHQQHILPNYRGFASLRTIKLSPPPISLWRLNSDSMTNCRDWGGQPGDVDLDKFAIDCSCPLFLIDYYCTIHLKVKAFLLKKCGKLRTFLERLWFLLPWVTEVFLG